jgi:hypothetical protein
MQYGAFWSARLFFFLKDILPFKINSCELVCFVFLSLFPLPQTLSIDLLLHTLLKPQICTIVHGIPLPLNSFNTAVCSLVVSSFN